MGVIKILSYLLCVKAFPSLTTNGFYSLKSETLSSSGTSTKYLRNAAAQTENLKTTTSPGRLGPIVIDCGRLNDYFTIFHKM